ncbi:MAG: S8 family serine peptidase, partial [Thaumarchaeota archaeon]|nr:S8 family serine peptidase [Nitrososphaerota archaeon]
MPKMAFVLICILMLSVLGRGTYGFYDAELLQQNPNFNFRQESDIIKFSPITIDNPTKRYIIFGSGSISPVKSRADNLIYDASSTNGFFSVGLFSEKGISDLKQKGYTVIEDFMLQFDSMEKTSKIERVAEGSRIGNIVGSEEVFQKYNLTGKGVTIGIVDTGADFSNPDMMDSLARDKNNIPIMIDTDGQGLVLTNSTFIANINENGIIKNYTKIIPKNITSSVYVNSKGVYLDLSKKGVGTPVLVYNSLLQGTGNPVLNGTISNDMKIGKTNRDFIISKSGIYHLGVIYQGYSQGPLARVQLVPVLVVDSKVAGMYNTIIPDMSTSWLDFNRFEQRSLTQPKYDFDFTDERPITLGNGKEFLVYDSNKDGKFDYSAGTVGAQVVDIYGVKGKQSSIDVKLKAVNGTLLQPLDPKGNYFGVMYDFLGHGTSSAATIASKGVGSYDLYSNSTKYSLRGIAPGAKIIPIKSLWLGDAVYGWLWAAGFSQKNNTWIFEGKPRVDIISNSWGIPNFPTLQAAPGLDVLSLVVSALAVPGSIDKNYPGTLFVTSAGNSGHGYGTIGIPAAVPYGLTVGATTNNVYVGTGQFKNQPRFGNSTAFSNNIADFSSRGPGLIGNPEPDLMGVGAYSFTPTSVTRTGKNATDPFVMFGGTSMAAPIVSGSAAILIESLKQKDAAYDPFRIKNILMSTATDLKNDPFSQGAGLVNVAKAVDFVKGKSGVFVVHNNVSYSNIKKVLDIPINSINSSSFGVKKLQVPDYPFPDTAWFAGRLYPGERTSATFTIENPTNDTLDIKIAPQNFELIEKLQYTGTTQVGQQDKLINKSGVYRPNYILLEDMIERKDLRSFFQKVKPIPDDASMMILNLNFPFANFMNSTEKLYANDMRISSLYFYDWNDKNKDGNVTSNELSMVNRGGSWGTVQEIRVSEPNSEIKNTPLVGVYPVPTRYSYWTGDTKKNSTSMDYTLTASFYKKKGWTDVWVNSNNIQVLPHSSSDITATLVVPTDSKPGVYQGFISFKSDKHEVNAPVSFGVKKKIQGKDMPTVIEGSKDVDVLYGNGYVGGAFDMVNRYNAGDWRQYYFDVQDST